MIFFLQQSLFFPTHALTRRMFHLHNPTNQGGIQFSLQSQHLHQPTKLQKKSPVIFILAFAYHFLNLLKKNASNAIHYLIILLNSKQCLNAK